MFDRMIHETAVSIAKILKEARGKNATHDLKKDLEIKIDKAIDEIWVDSRKKPILRVELYKSTLTLNPINEPGAYVLSSGPMDSAVDAWSDL